MDGRALEPQECPNCGKSLQSETTHRCPSCNALLPRFQILMRILEDSTQSNRVPIEVLPLSPMKLPETDIDTQQPLQFNKIREIILDAQVNVIDGYMNLIIAKPLDIDFVKEFFKDYEVYHHGHINSISIVIKRKGYIRLYAPTKDQQHLTYGPITDDLLDHVYRYLNDLASA